MLGKKIMFQCCNGKQTHGHTFSQAKNVEVGLEVSVEELCFRSCECREMFT